MPGYYIRQGGELVTVEMMFGYMSIMKFIFFWIEEETLGHWDHSTGKVAFHIVWDLSLILRLLRESWLPCVVFWPPTASLHEQLALNTHMHSHIYMYTPTHEHKLVTKWKLK